MRWTIAVTTAGVLLLYALLGGHMARRPQQRAESGSATRAAVEHLSHSGAAHPAVKLDKAGRIPSRPMNPIIERIVVDKTEVCRGEANFVHVDVKTLDDTDADLRIMLNTFGVPAEGGTGSRIPFRLFGAPSGDLWPQVVVLGWGAAQAARPIPYVKVKDCDAGPYLVIRAVRVEGANPVLFRFEATLSAVPISNVSWTFGDGITAQAATDSIVHDFSGRRQQSMFSEFLIRAESVDGDGRTLTGYKSMEFLNRDYLRHRRRS